VIKTPSIIQLPNHCGPACLAILAQYFGIETTQERIAIAAGTAENGTTLAGMLDGARYLGLKARYQDNTTFQEIRELLQQGILPIVDWFIEVTGHYSIVVGLTNDSILLRDPLIAKIREIPLDEFEQIWFDYHGPRPEADGFFVRRIIVVELPNQKS
jgi:ATP-binding cassette subfamily B protein